MSDEYGITENRWEELEAKKSSIHERNEKYARWTLPYLYPQDTQDATEELPGDLNSIGARAVNHLANRVTSTLFPAYRPFLKLELAREVRDEFKAAGIPLVDVDLSLVDAEKRAIRALDKWSHRTAATTAVKLAIITGNALMYYPTGENGRCQAYSMRDYSIVRDLSETPIEIITRDTKAFSTFSQDVQDTLHASNPDKKYESTTNVSLYTHIKLGTNGKYKVTQAADKVQLDINDNQYSRKDLPWVPISWNLVRGEDYARGMVEEYRGAFGAIDVLSTSLVEGIIGAAALKFLVNPGSVVDIVELNSSANGSYHVGRDGDVVSIKSDKHLDFQAVHAVVEDYSRQIAQAFLLNSAVTRDAERVTAEEIRYQAQELETAYGGIYSRFTDDWQEPVANLTLKEVDIKIGEETIFPTIVTGLDTLSRLGDLDNYRFFIQDLSLLATIPEEVKEYIKPDQLIMHLGNNRGIEYTKFTKTTQEVEQERAQQQQALQQQQMAETGHQMMADASKEIAKQELE